MKERIIAFLEAINLGSSQFAGEIGVQPSGISHILSGRNNPSLDFILKVLTRYPELSSEWLLFGRGEMFREAESLPEAGSDFLSRNERDSNQLKPEYNSGLFSQVENHDLTGRDKGDPIPFNETVEAATSALSADRMILVYSDGTFEQFNLRHDNSKNPLPGSDK